MIAVAVSNCATGVVDSSGIRFYYTDQAQAQNVGDLGFGHSVNGHMIIPPRVERYTVTGYCSQKCTNAVSVRELSHCTCSRICRDVRGFAKGSYTHPVLQL